MPGNKPKKSGDIVITKNMLDETREELNSNITTLRLETKDEFEKVHTKLKSDIATLRSETKDEFGKVYSEFDKVYSEFDKVYSEFDKVYAKIDEVKTELKSEIRLLRIEMQKQNSISHRCLTLYEEQNARNKYVLDGYDQIYRRQEEYEQRLKAGGL